MRIHSSAAMALRSAKLILLPAGAQVAAGAISFFAAAHRSPSTHIVQSTCLSFGQVLLHAGFVEINAHDGHGDGGNMVKAIALNVASDVSIS